VDEIKISRALSSHLSQISAISRGLELAGRQEEAAKDFGFLVSGYDTDAYRRFLDRADHFYVAMKDNTLIGFMLAYSSHLIESDEWLNSRIRERHDTPFILIKQIGVHQDYAGQGVGTSLYLHLFEKAPGLPCVGAIVLTPPNYASIRFHERLGFEKWLEETPPDGMLRGVWRREADRVLRG
jgi:GNAT superfamily N-acetyltransferase